MMKNSCEPAFLRAFLGLPEEISDFVNQFRFLRP